MTAVGYLISAFPKIGVTLSFTKHAGRSKEELLEEITRLEKELGSRKDEITVLKKKILLYKTI